MLILFLLSVGLLPLAVLWFILIHDLQAAQICFILLGVAFVSAPLFLLLSAEVRCPLCRGQVLGGVQVGSRNPKASRFLGSYRLRVILSLLLSGGYRCMHCGEPCDGTRPRHRR
jgi:hypothetical protein